MTELCLHQKPLVDHRCPDCSKQAVWTSEEAGPPPWFCGEAHAHDTEKAALECERRHAIAAEHEAEKETRYWRITVEFGGGESITYGGTAYSEEQLHEQMAMWLRHYADKIERFGSLT